MGISLPQGLNIQNNDPIDSRTIYETKESVLTSLNNNRRHRGLRIFITSEGKEYWFRDGITDDDFIPYDCFEDFVYGEDADEEGKINVVHNLHSTHIDIDVYDNEGNNCLVSHKCIDEDTIQLDFDCPNNILEDKVFKIVCRI